VDEVDMPQGNDDTTIASRRVIDGSDMLTGDFSPPPAILAQVVKRQKDQLALFPGGSVRYVNMNNRLKPFNFPARYVRHQNNVARIDVYPFEPYQDQQWRIVPGLADPAGVSFQSVNFPTRYLRHANFAMVLNENDSTAAFRADATFYPVAGFADATWTSYRSFNFPDRFLRHANFVLRIDPITTGSSTTDKQDATFRVVF